MYTLCRWYRVHVMLCTFFESSVVYRWYYVHVVQRYWCTCGILCMSYMLCCEHVVLCMWHSEMCIRCVVLYVHIFIVVYNGVGVCVMMYIQCRHMYCVVLYTRCRFMCAMLDVGTCIVWCHTLCVDVCIVMYIVYVYVIVERKRH